jgi:hypothetical protein
MTPGSQELGVFLRVRDAAPALATRIRCMADPSEVDTDTEVLFKQAMQLHQLGVFDRAARLYVQVLERTAQGTPPNRQALWLYNNLRRQVTPPPPSGPWRVVWQHDPRDSWEDDWLRYLLAAVPQAERVIDTQHAVYFDHMIVIDNHLSPASEAYYAQASFKGCRVVLVHLSDEWYADDTACYDWCDLVFRNHWTFVHADKRKLMFFPLGYKNGFSRASAGKPVSERRYVWSFMGDPKKSTRAAMLEALRDTGESFVHLTSGFNAGDALPTVRYREIMDESVFVPCPAGWQNLDNFRAWEALEAGCIPIVERRANFDYFAALCGGSYPFPSIIDWREATTIVRRERGELETLRRRCSNWWQEHKVSLRARIGAAITGLSAPTSSPTPASLETP